MTPVFFNALTLIKIPAFDAWLGHRDIAKKVAGVLTEADCDNAVFCLDCEVRIIVIRILVDVYVR